MQMDRRAFLSGSLASGVAALAAGQHRAAFAAARGDHGFARTTQVAEGVRATIADTKKGLQCYSNGGVIVGRDATLIIEGHYQKEGADLEIDLARAASKAPI